MSIRARKSDKPVITSGEEKAPCNHHLDLYHSEEAFLENLIRFLSEGIRSEETVVVIATDDHLSFIETELQDRFPHLDINDLREKDLFISIGAAQAMETFVLDNWPNEDLFIEFGYDLLRRAGSRNNRIRAFGEIVAVLCDNGFGDAALRLEHLWDRFCRLSGIRLLCAYPHSVFENFDKDLLQQIKNSHSDLIQSGH